MNPAGIILEWIPLPEPIESDSAKTPPYHGDHVLLRTGLGALEGFSFWMGTAERREILWQIAVDSPSRQIRLTQNQISHWCPALSLPDSRPNDWEESRPELVPGGRYLAYHSGVKRWAEGIYTAPKDRPPYWQFAAQGSRPVSSVQFWTELPVFPEAELMKQWRDSMLHEAAAPWT